MIAPGPIRDCDLAPVHRGVIMTFHREVAIRAFSLVLVPTPVMEASLGGGPG